MTKTKKILGIVLAVMLLALAMSISIFAQDTETGTLTNAYTSGSGYWGECGGSADESFGFKLYNDDTYMGSTFLNNVGGIIDGDVYVSWSIMLDAESNADEYWTMSWDIAPTIEMQPNRVEQWVDNVKVAECVVEPNWSDSIFPVVAAVTDENGKILSYVNGTESYTLADAFENGGNIVILRNIEESFTSLENVTLSTNVAGGVTITNTYADDYVNFNNVTIGNGVTLNIPYVFSNGSDSVNVIEGTLNVGATYYHSRNAKTTIQNGGKVTTGGMTVMRYNTAADAGIYIYGDNDATTVEFSCANTIGTYSGTFYVKDAVVEANQMWLDFNKAENNKEDSSYAQLNATFENSIVNVTAELKLYEDASLTLVGSNVSVKDVQIRANATPVVAMDENSTIKANMVTNLAGASLNAALGEDGTVSFKTVAALIGTTSYTTLAEAFAALKEGDTLTILAGEYSEGTIKLLDTLKDVTIQGEEGAILKDMGIYAADGNVINYVNLTFDNITFDNSNIVITGQRTSTEIVKNLTVTNCVFKNIVRTGNLAALNLNVDPADPVNGLTFTNNVIDGISGSSNSGIFTTGGITGKIVVSNNTINNVTFRPFILNVQNNDGIADELIVTGNTFSGSPSGRAQALGTGSDGADTVSINVNNNIFKDITQDFQICFWKFNPETTTTDLSGNYYDVDIVANPGLIYYNTSAGSVDDLKDMGIFPIYTELNEDGTIDESSAYPAAIVAQVGETKFATLAEAVEYLKANGGTLVLLADAYESMTFNYPAEGAPTEITIDLNGFTVTSAESTLWVSDGYIVTVKDSSDAKTGKIVTTNTSAEAIAIARGGKVILVSGTVEGIGYGVYLYGSNATGAEEFVVNGGVVTVPNNGTAITIGSGIVTVNGGEVLCNKTPITGGGWNSYIYQNGTMIINGGEFLGTIGNYGTIAIKGGTFSYCDDPNDGFRQEHLAFGYATKTNDNGSITVYALPTSLSGTGTAEDPYIISSLDELKFFRDDVNNGNQYNGKYVKLTTDINLAGIDWTPIGDGTRDKISFRGTFDGDGHTISNLYITEYNKDKGTGFFGVTGSNLENEKAVIKNLTFNNATIITTQSYVGVVVGNTRANTRIENVHVTGTIDISGKGYIGGIAGHGYVVMDNVSVVAKGTIKSSFWCAGGILGYGGEGSTNIMNAHVEGITITSAAGGLGAIVGRAEDNGGTQPISGSNLSAKNVEIKTYVGGYGESYANNGLGYLYGGNPTSNLTGTLTVENVVVKTSTGEAPVYTDAVATVNGTVYFSIQEAIKAAAPAGTVEVLRDVTVDKWVMFAESLSISNGQIITLVIDGLTINGNNHTLTINSIESAGNGNRLFFDATELNINDLTIKYKDGVAGGISLKDGTLDNVTFDGGVYGVLPQTGDVTIQNCTFKTNGTAIYFEEERDGLTVTGNTFECAEGAYAIILRGDADFKDNIVISGKVNAAASASGEISGNDFGTERFKVYNTATATITNNTINNLVFNDATVTKSTFNNNTLSESAQAALDAVAMPEIPKATVAPVINPAILFGLTFNADVDAITEEQLAYFGDWFADFTITFNKDMVLNANGGEGVDGWLAGQYDEFGEGWVKVPFENLAIEANKTYKVMELAAQIMNEPDLKLTYADVVKFVKEFNCGVYLTDEFIAENPDFSVEIGLSIFNPDDETIEIKTPCTDAQGNTMQTVFEKKDIKRVVAEIDGTYYTTLQDAINNANGKTVVVLENIVLEDTVTIPANTTVTLDLNGKTVSQTKAQTGNYQMILNDGNLTIVSSVEGGKLSYTDTVGGNFISNTITNRGTLTLKSGRVENMSSSAVADAGFPYAIDTSIWGAASEVVINIEGGEVYCESYSALRLRADSETERVDINITGGKVYGRIEVQNPSSNKATVGKLTISGGEIYKNNSSKAIMIFGGGGTAENMEVAITGGTITGVIGYSSVFPVANFNENVITGGTFTENVSDFCADGYTIVENTDGTYGVKEMPALPGAIVSPIGPRPEYVFGLNFAVDTNITDKQAEFFANWFADFVIVFNTDITLDANGTGDGWLTGQYDSYSENWVNVPFSPITIKAGEPVKIMEYAASIMNKPGLKFTCAEVFELVKNFNCGVYVTEEFIAENPDFEVSIALNVYNPVDEEIVYNVSEEKKFDEDDVVRVIASVKDSEGKETYYTTLADALTALKAGDTLTLLADAEINTSIVVTGDLTINGNGHKITVTGGAYGIDVKTGVNLVINDLTLESTSYAINMRGASDNATVEINDSYIKGYGALNIWGTNVTVNVNDSTLHGHNAYTSDANAFSVIVLNARPSINEIANGTTVNVNYGKIITSRDDGCQEMAVGRVDSETGLINISETTAIENNGGAEELIRYSVASHGDAISFTLQDAINNALAGETITLLRDVTLSDILVIDKSITLDGNGKKLTSTAGRAINVSGADGVTIKNLTIDCSGERAINIIQNATNVTIDNVTATASNYTVNVAGSAPNAVVTINESTLNGLCTVNVAGEGSKVTLTDSTINCNDNNTTAGESYAALCLNKDATNGKIIANGCTINVTENSDSVVAKNNAAGGEILIDGSSEGVVEMVAVITYPGSYTYYSFETLQAAIDYAKAGDTITLLRDITISDSIVITKDLTIDGNGHKITYTGSDRAITVESAANGANLTINNLTVDCTASSCKRGINYNTNGTLTLNGVTVIGTNVSYAINLPGSSNGAKVEIKDSNISGYGALNIWGKGVTVNVNNSTLHGHNNNIGETNAFFVIILNSDANDTIVNVNGGKIIASRGDGCEEMGVGRITSETGEIIISDKTVVENNGGIEEWITYGVARISSGGIAFTLQEAIDYVNAGETITLLRNITISEKIFINKSIVIDGNGKTITYTGSDRAIDIQIGTEGSEVTIKNLTVDCTASYCQRGISYGTGNGTLTLNGVTVKGTNVSYAINLPGSSNNAKVNIADSEFTGCIALNVWGKNAEITAVDSNFTSVDKATHENYAAIQFNNNGTTSADNTKFTITGGSITALDENEEKSAALYIVANGIQYTISDTTVVNGNIYGAVAVVIYEGYSEFYTEITLQDAINKATNDPTATVKLLNDIEVSEALVINGNVKIDLNGKKVTLVDATKEVNCVFNIENGTVSITNGTIVTNNGQAIYAGLDNNTAYAPVVTLDKVTLTGAEFGLSVFGGANVTLGADVVITGSVEALRVWDSASVTVNGATVTCTGNGTDARAIAVYGNANVTMSAGTVTGEVIAVDANSAISITGGTFTMDVTKYCANGYASYSIGDGKYIVDKANLMMYEYTNLTLGTDLSINFFYNINKFEGENYYAVITKHHESTCSCKDEDSGKDVVYYVPFDKWGVDNTGKYKIISANGVAAKEMVCDVFITIYKGTLDADNNPSADSVAVSITDVESVVKYVDRTYRYNTTGDGANKMTEEAKKEQFKLFADMLTYGKEAQIYFDHYMTDANGNPVYATNARDIFTEVMSYATTTDPEMNDGFTSTDADKLFYGTNLTLENTIYYNFWFKPGLKDKNVKVEFEFTHHDGVTKHFFTTDKTNEGDNVTGYIDLYFDKDGYLVVSVDDLAPADLRLDVTIKLYIDNDLKTTIVTSVEDHCAFTSGLSNTSESDKNLYKSIMRYADSAYAYFH